METSDILNEQLDALEELLLDIQKTVDLLSEEEEVRKEAGERLHRLNEAKRSISATHKQYEQNVVDYFENPLLLPDGTTLEARWSNNRKAWDHRGLAEKVAGRIVDESFDLDTGELTRSFPEMVERLLYYAGVGYWKTTVEELGISLDDYSTKEAKRSVSIRRSS